MCLRQDGRHAGEAADVELYVHDMEVVFRTARHVPMIEMGVQQREEVGAGGGGGYATRVVAIIIEANIGLTYLPDFTKHEGHGVYVFEYDASGKAHVAEHRRMKDLVASIGVFMSVIFNPIARDVLADVGNEIQERLFF